MLKNKAPEAPVYQYEIDADGLIAELLPDNSIAFKDIQTEEQIYFMPAPFMYDSSEIPEMSQDIAVTLELQSDQKYLMKYIPSEEWLNDRERVYPVTIDPSVQATNTYIADTYINAQSPSANYGSQEFLMVGPQISSLIKINNFSSVMSDVSLNANVVYASLNLRTLLSSSNTIGVAGVNSTWDESTVIYNTASINRDVIYDAQKGNGSGWLQFDVTDLVYGWCTDTSTNNGLALVNLKGSDYYSCYARNTATSAYRPYITVEYNYRQGYPDSSEVITQDFGRAGTSKIDLFTGKLYVKNNIMGFDGKLMPVDIDLILGPDCSANGFYTNGRFNYNQYAYKSNYTGYGEYTYKDEDGNLNLLTYDSVNQKWMDQDGTEYDEIGYEGSYLTFVKYAKNLSDKIKYYFESSGGGFLKKIETNNEYTPVSATVNVLTSGVIQSITDGAGRIYSFKYDSNNQCYGIEYLGTGSSPLYQVYFYRYPVSSENTRYTIAYPDGGTAYYELDSRNRIVKIADVSGAYCSYSYSGTSVKVEKILEYGSDGQLKKAAKLTYAPLLTRYAEYADEAFTQIKENTTVANCFDTKGNTLSKQTDDYAVIGNRYSYYYNSYSANDTLFGDEKTRQAANNVIPDPSFESGTLSTGYSFYHGGDPFPKTYQIIEEGHTGSRSLQVAGYSSRYGLDMYRYFDMPVAAGQMITLSAWIKTDTVSSVGLMVNDGNQYRRKESVCTDNKWKQISISVPAATALSEINVHFLFDGSGVSLLDDIQLYTGEGKSLNLINDSSMNRVTSGSGTSWICSNATVSTGTIPLKDTSAHYINFPSSFDAPSYVMQRVYLNSQKGDGYTLKVSGRIHSVISENYKDIGSEFAEKPFFGVKLILHKANGETKEERLSLPELKTGGDSVNTAYRYIALLADYDYCDIYLYSYCQGAGILLFPEWIPDERYQNLTYENDSGVIRAHQSTLDELLNIENDNTQAGSYLNKLNTTYTKDIWGNPTRYLRSNRYQFIATDYEYTANGNYLTKEKQGLGEYTAYNNDSNLGYLLSSSHADINTANYTYNPMGKLASLRTDVSGLDDSYYMQDTYGYNYDLLNSITRGSIKYTFGYDGSGKMNTLWFGNSANPQWKKLYAVSTAESDGISTKTETLDNGQQVVTTSDSVSGNKLSVAHNGSLKFQYTYDREGNKSSMRNTADGTVTDYTDGITTVKYTADGTQKHSFVYSGISAGSRLLQSFGTVTDSVDYIGGYDTLTAKYTKGGNIYSNQQSYNAFGNLSTDRVYNGTTLVLNRQLSYQSEYDEDIQKDHLYDRVSSLQIDNRIYAYTYYNNGKLKTVSKDGNLLYYYYYDAAGQLTRTDDSYQNKTYQYNYDSYGNIKTHNTYAYCDNHYGLTTSLISTRSYGYDSTDKNKLISYNGFPVSYGSSAGYYSGNPTSYYGNTYTWTMGNQLAGVSRDGKTVSFTYDDNGMRTSKTVNGIKTEYFNVDDKMTAQRTGNTLMIFRYDSEGKPFSVTYNGQEYFYGRNLGGDIVEIVDSSGNTVVSYLYDVWGAMVSLSGSLSTTLGLENPFRFKGMYYDTDAVLYYYGGRYYNPTWGRYLNADSPTALMNAQGDLLATNLYAFEHNDPVNHAEDYSEYGASWKYMPHEDYKKEAELYMDNCYSYAFQIRYGDIPFHINVSTSNVILATYDTINKTKKNKGWEIRTISGANAPIYDNEYRIALRVGFNYDYVNNNKISGDYHYMVQNRDGFWSQKPGIGFRTNFFAKGINPDNVLWNTLPKDVDTNQPSQNISFYASRIVYFAVKK